MAAKDAVTLATVLGQRLLVVPDYQRPYAWESKQLKDLWDDLDLMGEGSRHYTGTLVLMDQETEHMTSTGVMLNESHVVDGQQRLTTCLILLDRIRRAFLQIDMAQEETLETAHELGRTYGVVTVSGVTRPRLALGKDFNEFWVRNVLGDHQFLKGELTQGEQRMWAAARFFDQEIESLVDGFSAQDAARQLRRLLARVTSGLRFLVYEIDTTADAGVIFETLNGRGRDLSELDKIKNYLLFLARRLPDAQADDLSLRVNLAWSRIYENLADTGADEDLLLRAHWLATVNPDQRSWKGAASVKKRFARERYVPDAAKLSGGSHAEESVEDRHAELSRSVTDYVESLALCALFTKELLDPHGRFLSFDGSAATIRSRTAALRRSGVTAIFRPLLFAARLRHPDDGALYLRLTGLCEVYSARVFTIAQRRSNAGQSRLYSLANNLWSGGDPDAVLDQLEALVWEYADDDRVRAGLDAKENWYGRRGHKYFLYEYELEKARREEDVADFGTFYGSRAARTTEHVLPQVPDWTSGEWAGVTPEEHARLVHSIGNLSLTYDNSSYGRKSFAAKKGVQGQQTPPCYAESKLAQERELTAHDEWTAATIERRAADLASWALTRWPVSPPPVPDPELASSEEDDAGHAPDEDIPEARRDAPELDDAMTTSPPEEH